ncbi:class I SAM-dependent methyltransferase [Streptomyces sp. NPDC051211]|uniref:class I SAM-dependent methyltransferase n=1 Tax=Streptomyces sp. NPDC051211 TaxID=3154643 RepID=UPI00344F1E2E
MHQAEFRDPRLVAVYDAEFGWARDDAYFLAAVGETPGSRVLDLGCGTGRLTLALAAAGHPVTGVDPARASLDAARTRPGAARVTWVHGTSRVLPDASFDTAVMTGHVAQLFVADEAWARTLDDLRRALVPGGRLLFDTRDPADRRWERWNPVDSYRRIAQADGRTVTAWTEVTDVTDMTDAADGTDGTGVRDAVDAVDAAESASREAGSRSGGAACGTVVAFTHHCRLPDGERMRSSATLRFRTEAELRSSLRVAGFAVERIHGGWNGEPVGAGDGELLVTARAEPGDSSSPS